MRRVEEAEVLEAARQAVELITRDRLAEAKEREARLEAERIAEAARKEAERAAEAARQEAERNTPEGYLKAVKASMSRLSMPSDSLSAQEMVKVEEMIKARLVKYFFDDPFPVAGAPVEHPAETSPEGTAPATEEPSPAEEPVEAQADAPVEEQPTTDPEPTPEPVP